MYTSRTQTKKEERENSYDTKALGFKLQLFLNSSPHLFLEYPIGAAIPSGTVYFRHLCFYS